MCQAIQEMRKESEQKKAMEVAENYMKWDLIQRKLPRQSVMLWKL